MRKLLIALASLFAFASHAYAQTPVPSTLNFTTTSTAANTGTSVVVSVTANDFGGIISITVSLDGVIKQTCPNAAAGAFTCAATVTWVAGTVPHVVSTTAQAKSGLKLESSTTFTQ